MLAGMSVLSTSVSLASTLSVVTGVSSFVEAVSFTAAGPSLTGFTVMLTVAVAELPASSVTV